MEKRKTNKNAIYAFVFSLVSLVIFWWLGPVGIGCGIRALQEIKNSEEKGKVLAILGIVIGVIGLGIYFYLKIANI